MRPLLSLCLIALVAMIPLANAGLPDIDTTEIETESTPPVSPHHWVLMGMDQPLPERRDPFNLFNPATTNLRDVVDLIDEARDDEDVIGIVLRIDSPMIGWSQMQSIRRAIEDFRSTGKEVIAQMEAETTGGYLLATACDEIVMAREGSLIIPGINVEGIFLRGLLDLIGVQPDIIQMGIYKGAGDMFTERQFTDAQREAMTAIVDDLWSQMLTMIAEGRGLDGAEVENLIDQGLFTADLAVEAGLIDRVANPGEFETSLEMTTGDGFALVDDYGEEESEPVEFNLFEMFSMFQPPAPEPESTNPKIAIIYATGPIVGGRTDDSPFADPNIITSDDLIETLHECRDDDTIQAVVLRIDSPGGSALASDMILEEVRSLARAKPVVVSMGDTAASGGYYIAMGATEIFAEPATITGSIGVVGGKFVLQGLLEGHLGISHDVISRGQNAGVFSAWTPFSESEREAITALMADTYDTFTSKAAECRGMTIEALEAVAQGRIWTGNQAVENGLVDEIGGLQQAIERAEELVELEAWQGELEIVELPPPQDFFEWLVNYMGGEAAVALPAGLSSVLSAQDVQLLQQFHLIRSTLNREHSMTMMPVMLRLN